LISPLPLGISPETIKNLASRDQGHPCAIRTLVTSRDSIPLPYPGPDNDTLIDNDASAPGLADHSTQSAPADNRRPLRANGLI
jgi:hypothetical protein